MFVLPGVRRTHAEVRFTLNQAHALKSGESIAVTDFAVDAVTIEILLRLVLRNEQDDVQRGLSSLSKR